MPRPFLCPTMLGGAVMATMPPTQDLTAYAGDTWAQTFRFLDGGEPVDLTGAEVAATARAPLGTTYPLTATLGDETGEVTIAFADPLPFLSWDDYRYDVQVTQDGAVRTWIRGRLKVLRDVTNGDVPEPPSEPFLDEFADLSNWTESAGNSGGVSEAFDETWQVTINTPADYVQLNSNDEFDIAGGYTAEMTFFHLAETLFLTHGFGISPDPDTIPASQIYAESQGDGNVIVYGGGGNETFADAPEALRMVYDPATGTFGTLTFYASFDDGATWEQIGDPETLGVAPTSPARLYLYVYGAPGMADPSVAQIERIGITPA